MKAQTTVGQRVAMMNGARPAFTDYVTGLENALRELIDWHPLPGDVPWEEAKLALHAADRVKPVGPAYNPAEIYVTQIEQEAYDLGGQLALAQCRSHVAERVDSANNPFYVVICDAPEAYDRAREVRRKMFGS